MQISIVSDAWRPQVNGVVRTLMALKRQLRQMGHHVYMITPEFFTTVPCPTYPEIKLAIHAAPRMRTLMNRINADAVHIATEGPLGWAARSWCLKNGMPFTTAYHTAFPEYLAARTPFRADLFYPIYRRFHNAGSGVFVATATVRASLENRGFTNVIPWTRGVDTNEFNPNIGKSDWCFEGPIQLYVGRVAVEKNIEAFLESDVDGTKVVVGEGPALETLKAAYPEVHFLGALFGKDLARAYATADVFVFPSKTDTFGLVMIEALACGTPVAAYPVQGPLDVVGEDGCGPFEAWSKPIAVLNDDLGLAIRKALDLRRGDCAAFAHNYNWETVAKQFVQSLSMHEPLNDIPVQGLYTLPS